MQIAQISDGVIKAVQNIQLKPAYDGGRWWDLRDSMVLYEWMQQFGWQKVVNVPRPSDTTSDWTKTVELVEGVPTEVWVVSPWAVEELASQAASANQKTIEQKLATKLENMQAILDQTNAAIRTDPSQEVKDLARAVRLLTRLQLSQYDGAD